MSVQTSAQSLLVQEVSNETDRPTEHEKTVEYTHAKVVLGLFGAESTTVSEEINEADCNTTVNVEDQVVFLGGSDGLDGDCVFKHLARGEVLLDEFFDKLDTQIRVVSRFDPVANTRDWMWLANIVDR